MFLDNTVVNWTLTLHWHWGLNSIFCPGLSGFNVSYPQKPSRPYSASRLALNGLRNMTFPIILCHSYLYFLIFLSSSLLSPRVVGTIAEREHRKWESAPPLPNNPYSPENINKRLSRQSAGFSTRSSSVVSTWVLAGCIINMSVEPHRTTPGCFLCPHISRQTFLAWFSFSVCSHS